MSITLYKAQELATVEAHTDEETGEFDKDGFDAANITLVQKQRAVVAYIKNKNVEIAMLESALHDITEKYKSAIKRADSLNEYLLFNMKQSSVSKIEAEDGTFQAVLYKDRDTSIELQDGVEFPLSLCNEPRKPSPSKTKIKAAIEAGEAVAGARIVRKDRLVIK